MKATPIAVLLLALGNQAGALPYPVVDTGQSSCYGTNSVLAAPAPGTAFAGQDAQYAGTPMSYALGGDGLTVHDLVTGLTWTRSPDLDQNGVINYGDKLSQTSAVAYAATLNALNFGGYGDWRLPSIQEQYSLIDFRGGDPSSYAGTNVSSLRPFLDTNFFRFGFGDTNAGDRVIDAQVATCTIYAGTTMMGDETMFGVNFADGRIKGYPRDASRKVYYAYFVRGNTAYGLNDFATNGDGTVTDHATGLMWQQADSGSGLDWQAALAYAENLHLAGWQDWRLPNAKELQSIVDYTRCPDVTASPAIDPVFACTAITNEGGVLDYPCYWTGTTHADWQGSGRAAAYVCFGRALGYFNGAWRDVHGAGAQRSDPKTGNPASYPFGFGPQGDAIRISNFVRCVRSGATPPATDSDSDGIPDWTEYDYATNATAMTPSGDLDGDGFENLSEIRANTSPVSGASLLALVSIAANPASHPVVTWQSALGKSYTLRRSTNIAEDAFSTIVADGIPATPPLNVVTDSSPVAGNLFYLISTE